MSEVRAELVFPPEHVVLVIAGALAVAYQASGVHWEPEQMAEKAWDLYQCVFDEADTRFPQEEEDGKAEGGGSRDTGPSEGGRSD